MHKEYFFSTTSILNKKQHNQDNNLPWTVCPEALVFSLAARNWSEITKDNEVENRKTALNTYINLISLISYLL